MDLAFFTAILAPLGVYALAVPMPGPGFAVISRASIVHGASNGAAAALGTTGSVAIYAAATVLGISALLTALPWLTGAIEVCGGGYLVYIGISLLRSSFSRSSGFGGASRQGLRDKESLSRSFRRGLLVGLGNPKMAAFFLGLFAPALSGAMPSVARLAVLGGLILIDLLYHQMLAVIAAKGSGVVGRAGRWFDAAVGGCMTAFGCALIARSLSRS